MLPSIPPTDASITHAATLTDRVEQGIVDMVRRIGLKPGELLPNETDLARRFDVSRGVVREAVTRLQGLGLVDRRKKRGTLLNEPDLFGRLRPYVIPSLFSDASITELFELRLVMELGSAELVCDRIDDDALALLSDLIEQEQSAPSVEQRVGCDLAFHAALYDASGNPSLHRFQALLEPFFRMVVEDDRGRAAPVPEASHRDVLAAVSSRDADRYRSAMRAHLEPYRERYSSNASAS